MAKFRLQLRADHVGRPGPLTVTADRVIFPAPDAGSSFVIFENNPGGLVAAYNSHAVASVTLIDEEPAATDQPAHGTPDVEVVGTVHRFGQREPVRTLTRPVPKPPHTMRDARA